MKRLNFFIFFLILIPLTSLAGDGALGIAHKLGFFGCGKQIENSQKFFDKWIGEGKFGNFSTKVTTVGLNKPVKAISIETIFGIIQDDSIVSKTGPDDSCQSQSFFMVYYHSSPCSKIEANSGDRITSNAGYNITIAKTPGGSEATFSGINDGNGCIETINLIGNAP